MGTILLGAGRALMLEVSLPPVGEVRLLLVVTRELTWVVSVVVTVGKLR